jgi:hypothetical protein
VLRPPSRDGARSARGCDHTEDGQHKSVACRRGGGASEAGQRESERERALRGKDKEQRPEHMKREKKKEREKERKKLLVVSRCLLGLKPTIPI